METTSHSLLWLIFSRLSLREWPLDLKRASEAAQRGAQGAGCMDGRAL